MFGGNPLGNVFQEMHNHMRQMDQMMNAMMGPDPFGGIFGHSFDHPHRQMIGNAPHSRHDGSLVPHPFDGMGMMGGGLFGGFMNQMEQMQERAMSDPNSMVFTQSTMISYDGNGKPKVVQASTRKAGEVKETRRQVQSGEELEELSVGHSIGDRSHVIEKKRDKDGRLRQQQKFVNMDAEDAEHFNSEYKSRAKKNLSSSGISGLLGVLSADNNQKAIEDGSGRRHQSRKAKDTKDYHHQPHPRERGGESSNAPIITIPDDDDDDRTNERGYHRGRGGKGRQDNGGTDYYSMSRGGPTIREISEEEADQDASAKRRKGFFEKYL